MENTNTLSVRKPGLYYVLANGVLGKGESVTSAVTDALGEDWKQAKVVVHCFDPKYHIGVKVSHDGNIEGVLKGPYWNGHAEPEELEYASTYSYQFEGLLKREPQDV